MYYEEKWIDGKLCYRHTPDGDFVEYTIISYRNALWELQQQVKPVDLADVVGRSEQLCECEAHTFYEWEKLENKCTDCGKKIY